MHFALHWSDGIDPAGESRDPDGTRGQPTAPTAPTAPVAYVGSAVPATPPAASPDASAAEPAVATFPPLPPSTPSPAETAAAAEAARRAVAEAADRLPPGILRPAVVPLAAGGLAQHRDAVRARYRWALSAEEAIVHRRLLNAGRIAEARALVEQAERFFLTARQAIALMQEEELVAFERAIDRDDAAQRTRILAAALRREGREAAQRLAEAPRLTQALDPFAGADPTDRDDPGGNS